MSRVPLLPLEDLIVEIIDRRGVTPRKLGSDFTPEGYRVISARSIRNRTVDLTADDERYVSEEVYRRWMKTPLRRGDVLLTSEAPLGEPAYVQEEHPWVVGQRLFAIRTDPTKMIGRFLFYAVQSRLVGEDLLSRATGTTVLGIRQSELRRVNIPVPSLADQREIVEILGALDDKIELNRRMSETLHQIAESTFKDMFLPSAIGTSEISEVAESTIGDEIDVTMGQSPPGSTYNTEGQGLPFYQGRTDFGMLFPTRRVYCTAPTRLAREGDTLLSVRAPVGDVNVAVEDCAIGRGVAALRHRSGSRVFTYFLARSLHATFDQFNGEGTVFGSISKKALLGLACPKPSDSQLHAFEKIGGPILLRLRSAMQESDTLISIRDALLPKLISGELRVPQAEQLVSEVV